MGQRCTKVTSYVCADEKIESGEGDVDGNGFQTVTSFRQRSHPFFCH